VGLGAGKQIKKLLKKRAGSKKRVQEPELGKGKKGGTPARLLKKLLSLEKGWKSWKRKIKSKERGKRGAIAWSWRHEQERRENERRNSYGLSG